MNHRPKPPEIDADRLITCLNNTIDAATARKRKTTNPKDWGRQDGIIILATEILQIINQPKA